MLDKSSGDNKHSYLLSVGLNFLIHVFFFSPKNTLTCASCESCGLVPEGI